MASLLQLQAESAWRDEYAPPSMVKLFEGLRAYLGVGPVAVGAKGDEYHLRGYHRSRRWVLTSAFSLYGSRDYSVQHDLDRGGDEDWLCAMDATPKTTAQLIAMCRRLSAAVKSGKLPQVREWYGNVDGNQVVDGWDSVAKRAATSDSSHLWHLHVSFFRSRANWDHSNLLAVLTGEEPNPMAKIVQIEGEKPQYLSWGRARRDIRNRAELDQLRKVWGATVQISPPPPDDPTRTPAHYSRDEWLDAIAGPDESTLAETPGYAVAPHTHELTVGPVVAG